MVVKVRLGEWTRLPRLTPSSFKELMRAGVKYESGRGFLVQPGADLAKVKQAISSALNGAPVEFTFSCFMCGKEISCGECEYYPTCSIESSSPACICRECLEGISLEDYAKKWKELVEA